ncbi:MAG: hypothetical protein U9N52_09875 [Campylobacterota bacterium]|nr:hypothetical protein [Campylobacterota bacterium]
MRYILIFLITLLFLTGCSRTTAFDFFKMDDNYERAVDNLQTGTIVRSFETEAILSTVYLNRVYPEKYNDAEYFFVSIYLRDDIRLYFKAGMNNKKYHFTLNGEKPIEGKELKTDDELRLSMPISNEWNRYYLVKFPLQYTEKLDLILENDEYDSVELIYYKNED